MAKTGAIFSGDILEAILDVHLGVVPIFIQSEDLLAAGLDFFLVHHVAWLHRNIAPNPWKRDLNSSLDEDLLENWTTLEKDGDLHSIAEGFRENAHIGDAASRVEGSDILLRAALAVGLADLSGEVGKNAFFRDAWGADRFDHDVFHYWSSGIRRSLRDAAHKEGHQKQSEEGRYFGVSRSKNNHGFGRQCSHRHRRGIGISDGSC